jgi:Dolichyl-phosphate-mannose-protein mannosyltransferase
MWPKQPLTVGLYLLLFSLGAYLRLDQLAAQVLIDDEWHALHKLLQSNASQIALSFGYADHSIPLTLYDYWLANTIGLNEWRMRLPLLLAGLATLVLLPRYVAQRCGHPVALVFLSLLSASPLLINYSRNARPYALSLLLTCVAIGAFLSWYRTNNTAPALTYVTSAVLATWLHPVVGPLIVAPFIWAFASELKVRQHWPRLLILGSCTALLLCACILPPLLTDPQALAGKSGHDLPSLTTWWGAFYAWFGVSHTLQLLLFIVLATLGAPKLWQAFKAESQVVLIGLCLALILIGFTKPMWVHHPLTLARYALIALPLLLLSAAFGLHRLLGKQVPVLGLLTASALLSLTASPLWEQLRSPNHYTLHSHYQLDPRTGHNDTRTYQSQIILSDFWQSLSKSPPSSLRIAAAPFQFESYNNTFQLWQTQSKQVIQPFPLQGFCLPQRAGEVTDPRIRLDNQASLDDPRLDFIVWQKPLSVAWLGKQQVVVEAYPSCLAKLHQRFGPTVFEDPNIVVFTARRKQP